MLRGYNLRQKKTILSQLKQSVSVDSSWSEISFNIILESYQLLLD